MAYDPNAWVGANDPTRAADIQASYARPTANDPLSMAIRGMLDRYNAPGGYTPAAGAPQYSPNTSVYGRPTSRMGNPIGAPTGLQTPGAPIAKAPGGYGVPGAPTGLQSARRMQGSTGNMFLDGTVPAAGAGIPDVAPPAGPLTGEYIPAAGGIPARTSPTGTLPVGAPVGANGAPMHGGNAVAPGAVNPLNGYMDPSYQFRLDEGMRALQSGAAAGGNLLSGQTLKDLLNYGQGAASQEYGNAYNRMNTDRNYQTALEEWNRTFGRDTSQADRAYNTALQQWNQTFGRDTSQQDWSNDTQTLQTLLNAGFAGTSGSSQVQQLLARLISAGAIAQGQTGAAQTGAGSNLWSNLITQLLQLGPGS